MTTLKWIGLAVGGLVVAFGALYLAMAERVEVVVVQTHDAEGDHATRLWIVDNAGSAWLRTGADNTTWLPRLTSTPAIEVERQGNTLPFTALVVADPTTVARINELSLAKYGWSESLLRAMTPDGREQVAIRLVPR